MEKNLNLITNPAKDPNAELSKMGVEQDAKFGSDKTIFKQDKLGVEGDWTSNRVKYFKINTLEGVFVGSLTPGVEKPAGSEYIGVQEYLKLSLGEKEYNRLKGHYRDYRRFCRDFELKIIRGDLFSEKKLLGK